MSLSMIKAMLKDSACFYQLFLDKWQREIAGKSNLTDELDLEIQKNLITSIAADLEGHTLELMEYANAVFMDLVFHCQVFSGAWGKYCAKDLPLSEQKDLEKTVGDLPMCGPRIQQIRRYQAAFLMEIVNDRSFSN